MRLLKNLSAILLLTLAAFFATCKKMPETPDRMPVANSGADQTVIFPQNVARLSGEGSGDPDDPSNRVTTYFWRKISGPESYQIDTPRAKSTLVKNLDVGLYHFELKVTGLQGQSSTDTVTVTVEATGIAPVAIAGRDTTINIAYCYDHSAFAELDGTASFDPDNTPITYKWTQIKGNSVFMSSPNASKNRVGYMLPGEYDFELLIKDGGGKSSRDSVHVSVPGTTQVFDLNISSNTTYLFFDNFGDGYYNLYSDIVKFTGTGNFQPLGDFGFQLDEDSDTSNLADTHNTILHLYNGNNGQNFISGSCSVNFKKLIVNGGGSFSGLFTLTDASALACDPNVINNTEPLSIAGNINVATRSISLTIKGKIKF